MAEITNRYVIGPAGVSSRLGIGSDASGSMVGFTVKDRNGVVRSVNPNHTIAGHLNPGGAAAPAGGSSAGGSSAGFAPGQSARYTPDPTVNGPWTHTRSDIPLFRQAGGGSGLPSNATPAPPSVPPNTPPSSAPTLPTKASPYAGSSPSAGHGGWSGSASWGGPGLNRNQMGGGGYGGAPRPAAWGGSTLNRNDVGMAPRRRTYRTMLADALERDKR